MRSQRRGTTSFVATLLVLAVSACQAPSPQSSRQPVPFEDPRTLLTAARQAAVETRGVRYRFEFGPKAAPSTWATGETWMLQRGGASDSLIRVEGKLRNWDEEPAPFLFSTDGQLTRAVDFSTRSAEIRKAGDGDRSLGGLAVYGYFTEFVEKLPYWKELDQAESLRLLASERVEDVECYVVEAKYHLGTPRETRHLWYLAKDDLLPRGLRWSDLANPTPGEFWLYDVQKIDLDTADFGIAVPPGFTVADFRDQEPEVPNQPAPDWSLVSSTGETVSVKALRGQVVVLDFWNTWCFICRALQPQMEDLARRFGDPGNTTAADVVFFGVNVFENEDADPDAYWTELAHSYDYLQDGDEVARLYDLPWQPGVVVLGRDGAVVYSLLGGTGSRRSEIERAIEQSL